MSDDQSIAAVAEAELGRAGYGSTSWSRTTGLLDGHGGWTVSGHGGGL